MKNILLIEPNSVLASLYQQMLTAAGYQVAHVASAQTGVDAADKQRPAVVILELQLPKHNGIEFLHEFRSYPEWADIPVIVHTAIAPSRITPVAEALRADLGVTAILYKPQTSLAALLEAVQEQTL